MTSRRHFLAGLATLLATPAIVQYQSIMPVRLVKWTTLTIDTAYYTDVGVHVWESGPWMATIDYSKVDPANIDFELVDIKCSYLPPGYDVAESVPQWFVPVPPPATIKSIETLNAERKDRFKIVSPEEVMAGAMPKVVT